MSDRILFVKPWQLEINDAFTSYKDACEEVGSIVFEQCQLVTRIFEHVGKLIEKAVYMRKPETNEELIKFMEPLPTLIADVENHLNKNHSHDLYKDLVAVNQGLPVLTWISWDTKDCPKTAIAYFDSCVYFVNKLLPDYKDNGPRRDIHKTWLSFLDHVIVYLKTYHKQGMNWKTEDTFSLYPPPPPPVPPSPVEADATKSDADETMASVMRQINVGENITKNLKHITQKTGQSSSSSISSGSSADSFQGKAILKSTSIFGKPIQGYPIQGNPVQGNPIQGNPKHELQGKRWAIEYQTDTKVVVEPEYHHTMYAYKCIGTFIEMKKKVLGVTFDSCQNLDIVLGDVVSSVELINCKNIRAQTFGKMPTLSICKSDDVLVYLNKGCLDAQIITEKSSDVNILVPTEDETDFVEHSIPEQFMSVFVDGILLSTPILKK